MSIRKVFRNDSSLWPGAEKMKLWIKYFDTIQNKAFMKKMAAFRGLSIEEQILDPQNQDVKQIFESGLIQISHRMDALSHEEIEFTRIFDLEFKKKEKQKNLDENDPNYEEQEE